MDPLGDWKIPGHFDAQNFRVFWGGREKNENEYQSWCPMGARRNKMQRPKACSRWTQGLSPGRSACLCTLPSRRPFTPAPATKVSSPDANCGRMPLFCTTLRAWRVMHGCMCTTGHAWVYVHDWFEKRLSVTGPLPGAGVVVWDGHGLWPSSLPQGSHDRCATASHKMPGRTSRGA